MVEGLVTDGKVGLRVVRILERVPQHLREHCSAGGYQCVRNLRLGRG